MIKWYLRIRRPPILEERDAQLQLSVLLQNGAIQVAIQRSRKFSEG